jgi:hypothetical protein
MRDQTNARTLCRMILDVDTDIDDTMAILFALCGPRIVAAYISSPRERQTEGANRCLPQRSLG